MEDELLKELNGLRKYLEISKKEFVRLLSLAYFYKQNSNQYISNEMLYQIIEEALVNMDYENQTDFNIRNEKSTLEAFKRALNNLGYDNNKRKK